MDTTQTQAITQLYREIIRLGAEALTFPVLAVKRGRQITQLYAQIATLKAVAS
jgi:hypothetical protein